MSEIETGGPAFPFADSFHPNGQVQYGSNGMTLRQYAAIKLRVPNSGDAWLDEMITTSLRNDLAAEAMPEIYQRVEAGGFERVANLAYELADAMLKARRS